MRADVPDVPAVSPRRAVLSIHPARAARLALPTSPASAYPGAPWLRPRRTYTSNFPDPSVLRVGNGFIAYGTSTGCAYLLEGCCRLLVCGVVHE